MIDNEGFNIVTFNDDEDYFEVFTEDSNFDLSDWDISFCAVSTVNGDTDCHDFTLHLKNLCWEADLKPAKWFMEKTNNGQGNAYGKNKNKDKVNLKEEAKYKFSPASYNKKKYDEYGECGDFSYQVVYARSANTDREGDPVLTSSVSAETEEVDISFDKKKNVRNNELKLKATLGEFDFVLSDTTIIEVADPCQEIQAFSLNLNDPILSAVANFEPRTLDLTGLITPVAEIEFPEIDCGVINMNLYMLKGKKKAPSDQLTFVDNVLTLYTNEEYVGDYQFKLEISLATYRWKYEHLVTTRVVACAIDEGSIAYPEAPSFTFNTLNYIVNDDAATFGPFDEFIFTPENCDFQFTYSAKWLYDGELYPLPYFASLDSATRTFTVYTDNYLHTGDFEIVVTATLNDGESSFDDSQRFTISIDSPCRDDSIALSQSAPPAVFYQIGDAAIQLSNPVNTVTRDPACPYEYVLSSKTAESIISIKPVSLNKETGAVTIQTNDYTYDGDVYQLELCVYMISATSGLAQDCYDINIEIQSPCSLATLTAPEPEFGSYNWQVNT